MECSMSFSPVILYKELIHTSKEKDSPLPEHSPLGITALTLSHLSFPFPTFPIISIVHTLDLWKS